MSPTHYGHGRGQAQLAFAFQSCLPGLKVVTETDVVLPHNRIRVVEVDLRQLRDY